MSDSKDIDDVLNSENSLKCSETSNVSNISNVSNNLDKLDIDADTETMNNQLDKHMKKQNKNIDQDQPIRICQIDKNMLKTLIVEWLSLDDQIKSYNDVIKDLKEEKKQFETQILDLMGTLNQEVILTDKGNLTRTVKETKEALTPDLIKTTLSEILKCVQTADTYTTQIMEKRKVKEVINLKRKDVDAKKKSTKSTKSNKSNKPNKPTRSDRSNDNNDNNDNALNV